MSKLLRNIKGDKTIWLIVAILTVYSVLAVYSATGTLAFRYKGGNTEYFLFKHLGTVLLGLSLMYVAHLVKYTYYSRISQIALYIAVPLLVLTLFSGTNVNDAARWLTLPVINISFQTSDFAKLALIMFLARMLSKKQENIKTFKEGFIPIVFPILITCAFIIPANFSTAAILFASSLILLFVGRVKFQHLLALLLTGIVSVTIFIAVISMLPDGNRGRIDTWKQRIESFRTKDVAVNYQAEQSRIAIASGGIFGKFPGNSTQRDYLPQPFSDFIFSIIIEEYGLLGGIFIVLLYLILLYRSIRIAGKSPGTFGAFLALGLSFMLVFQAMVNMAVAVNLMPVTGQPLPMVSMGGTSMWFTSLSIGIILSVSKEIDNKQKPENSDE